MRLVVDSTGRVMPDSIMICGVPNAGYARQLAQQAAGIRFVKSFNGAPVAGPTRIDIRF